MSLADVLAVAESVGGGTVEARGRPDPAAAALGVAAEDGAGGGAARAAAALCESRSVDIAQLALQFSIANPDVTTTVSGSANPDNIRKWAKWAAEPMDMELLADVQKIFEPVKNLGHAEGLPENN